jgi:hypothetical protein
MTTRVLVLAAVVAAMSFSGGRAHAFDGEQAQPIDSPVMRCA